MTQPSQPPPTSCSIRVRRTRLAFAVMLALAVVLAMPQRTYSQTFKVVYNFQGVSGGFYPTSGVSVDRAGNLYGTTQYGGAGTACYLNCGIVFKLTRQGSGWLFNPIYSFKGGSDGGSPNARPIVGPDGSLFGTTSQGGGSGCYGMGCGTVFNLRPPQRASGRALAPWAESVIYRFQGGSDGGGPQDADLVFDQAGNLYGTTEFEGGSGCSDHCGTVYQLTKSNGTWTESTLHVFGQTGDGDQPWAGAVFDRAGNLYGTTSTGGAHRSGAAYELIRSGSGWSEQVLYSLQSATDGAYPYAGFILDAAGNLYSTACCNGAMADGSVYELTAATWTFNLLYALGAAGTGQGPEGGLVMDSSGNLYGTASSGGAYGFGAVFKLSQGAGGWTYTSIHDFCAGGYPPCSDGYTPSGNLAMDSSGNLYGTTANGGAHGGGVVYEITP